MVNINLGTGKRRLVSLTSQSIPFGRVANTRGTIVTPSRAKLPIKPMGNAPTATLNNFHTKRGKVDNLQFPLDVTANEGLGNHGHYIMFYINAVEDARLTTEEIDKNGKGSIADDISQKYSKPKFLRVYDSVTDKIVTKPNTTKDNVVDNMYNQFQGKQLGQFEISFGGEREDRDQTVKYYEKVEKEGSTIFLTRRPTKRLKSGIALFMPPQISTTYTSNYTDTEIGGGTEAALNAFNAAVGNRFDRAADAFFATEEPFKEGVEKLILSTIGTVAPGLGGIREGQFAKQGAIISDRMELAFKGINKRQFQYTFKMIPRSQAEADEIRKIIFIFKQNMLPEFVGGNRAGRRLRVPNTFDIQYMYKGKQNEYLHHISTCVLETMSVQYGGDRYKTFPGNSEGAPPVETQITLNFKEMELITRERVFEGF